MAVRASNSAVTLCIEHGIVSQRERVMGRSRKSLRSHTNRDPLGRCRADGLSAERAAKAVGKRRATLYRREERPDLRSRRPREVRAKTWTNALVRAVAALRLDCPMWGKAKLGPLLRAQGFVISDATVGCIIKSLVDRGVINTGLSAQRHSPLSAAAQTAITTVPPWLLFAVTKLAI